MQGEKESNAQVGALQFLNTVTQEDSLKNEEEEKAKGENEENKGSLCVIKTIDEMTTSLPQINPKVLRFAIRGYHTQQ